MDGSGSGFVGTNPCHDCRAEYQSGGRVSGHRNGSGAARRSGQGREPVRHFHLPPKILATFLSLSLFTFLLPRVDECTSSKIGLRQGEKSENLRCVVRISKRESKGEVRK